MANEVLIGCVTFNRHAFALERFLKALQNQTFKSFDMLVVDNSETDAYAKFLKNKGMKVLQDPPAGKNRIQRIVSGRETIRKEFLTGAWKYLLFLDTDIIIPPDAVQKLAEHAKQGKDIVSGVCVCRMTIEGHTELRPALYDFAEKGKARLMGMEEVVGTEVREIDVSGFGCCMIRRDVLEQVPLRYYETSQSGEDVAFNVDAHKLGFKTFVDTSIKCRHFTRQGTLDVPLGPRVDYHINYG